MSLYLVLSSYELGLAKMVASRKEDYFNLKDALQSFMNDANLCSETVADYS